MIIKEFKERPNQHQTHLESLVTLGRDGLEEINDKIEKFIRSFTGTNELNVTSKIDGSPAVICWSKFEGYPDNSICLKSFIASNQNCLSSVQQIEERYGDREDMAEKLMYCLQLAKCIPAGEAWQGDCLFTSSDKKVIDILGKEYLTFQPNKIVYAFSEDNPGYDLIKNSNFGICFHTIYKGNLEHKTQSFKVDASRLLNVPSDIYVMSPVINAPKEKEAYNLDLINDLFGELKEVENKLISTDAYEDLCSNVAFKQYWDMFENANLSDKLAVTISEDTFYNDLKEFIHSKLKTEYDKKFASLKTEKGKLAATEKYLNSLQELDNILEYNKDVLVYFVRALNLTAKIKMLMWNGYKKSNQGYSTFYNTKYQGYIPADMEGVAMSDMEGSIVKIVDRSTFSHANRSDDYIGGWQHESLEENKQKDIIKIQVIVEQLDESILPSGDKVIYDEQTLEDWYDFAATIEGIIERNGDCVNVNLSKNENSLSEYIDFYTISSTGERQPGMIDLRLSDRPQTNNARRVRKNHASKLDNNFIMKTIIVNDKHFNTYDEVIDYIRNMFDMRLEEDTEKKRNGKWVNKGKAGEHGEFKTKKEADAQRKAIFASGWHEGLEPVEHLSNIIDDIDCIYVYDDASNMPVTSLNEAIEDNVLELLDLPDELFLDYDLSNESDINVLDRLAKLDKSRLTRAQLDRLQSAYSEKFIISADDVKSILSDLRNCNRLYIVQRAKNSSFLQKYDLYTDDCLEIIHNLKLKDYIANTKNTNFNFLSNNLIIFQPSGVVLSNGKKLGDIEAHIKLDIDGDNNNVAAISFHEAEFDSKKPYIDLDEDRQAFYEEYGYED